MKSCKNLKGGLQEVAEQLEIQRVGPQHQAGSDALLTGMVFFKMREVSNSTQLNLIKQLITKIHKNNSLLNSFRCFLRITLMMRNTAGIYMVWERHLS